MKSVGSESDEGRRCAFSPGDLGAGISLRLRGTSRHERNTTSGRNAANHFAARTGAAGEKTGRDSEGAAATQGRAAEKRATE